MNAHIDKDAITRHVVNIIEEDINIPSLFSKIFRRKRPHKAVSLEDVISSYHLFTNDSEWLIIEAFEDYRIEGFTGVLEADITVRELIETICQLVENDVVDHLSGRFKYYQENYQRNINHTNNVDNMITADILLTPDETEYLLLKLHDRFDVEITGNELGIKPTLGAIIDITLDKLTSKWEPTHTQ